MMANVTRRLPSTMAVICLVASTAMAQDPRTQEERVAIPTAGLAAQAKRGSFAEFDARAKAGERLNVVFFGASLTWGANASDPVETSYRAVMRDRFEKEYPAAHFRFRDSAIGGTGSQLGVFRLDRDVLARKPDLLFLDFSANDDITSTRPTRSRTSMIDSSGVAGLMTTAGVAPSSRMRPSVR